MWEFIKICKEIIINKPSDIIDFIKITFTKSPELICKYVVKIDTLIVDSSGKLKSLYEHIGDFIVSWHHL